MQVQYGPVAPVASASASASTEQPFGSSGPEDTGSCCRTRCPACCGESNAADACWSWVDSLTNPTLLAALAILLPVIIGVSADAENRTRGLVLSLTSELLLYPLLATAWAVRRASQVLVDVDYGQLVHRHSAMCLAPWVAASAAFNAGWALSLSDALTRFMATSGDRADAWRCVAVAYAAQALIVLLVSACCVVHRACRS